MRKLKGIAASAGVGIGPARLLSTGEIAPRSTGESSDEHARFRQALERSRAQIQALRDRVRSTSRQEAEIFDAHLLLLEDPMLLDGVDSRIAAKRLSADEAVAETVAEFSTLFEALQDEYIRARASDLQDIGRRIRRNLSGDDERAMEGGVWVARELLPSDVAAAHAAGAVALACEAGALNSHAAILARSLGIPAVFAVRGLSEAVSEGELVIVDGGAGGIILGADAQVLAEYRSRVVEAPAEALRALRGRVKPSAIRLKANISGVDEAAKAIAAGADGIGVVRTEFLFVDRDRMPDEEEQFRAYAAIVRVAGAKPVAIRTLDAGSDKPLSYLSTPQEPNPALGLRGLRISLALPEIFRAQLRAILRASTLGPVQILLPMVSNAAEFHQARAMVEQAAAELRERGIAVGKVPVGAMIEVPAAALNAESLAEPADFLSIGTNDLVQYTLAADRTNETVAHLYNELDPAVLQLIRLVVKAGRKHRRPVSVCGEMAANLQALPVLLEIGIRELSMSPAFIPRIREALAAIK